MLRIQRSKAFDLLYRILIIYKEGNAIDGVTLIYKEQSSKHTKLDTIV